MVKRTGSIPDPQDLKYVSRLHMEMFMSAVRDHLPADVRTVHEYGCRFGGGLELLREYGYDAKAFDKHPPTQWDIHDDAIECRIEDVAEDADLIVALHIFESGQLENISVSEAIGRVLAHCRYFGLSVHPNVSQLGDAIPDDRVLYHQLVVMGCYIDEHDVYLLKGDL